MSTRAWARQTVGAIVGLARRRPTPGRILLYHRIGAGSPGAFNVPTEVFRQHLDAIIETGSRCVTVAAAVRASFPPGSVALSFDDGDISVVAACADVVARGGGATLFLVPAWAAEARAGHVTWRTARELADGGIEIGTHGWDHRPLRGDPARACAELRDARIRTEHEIGMSVAGMAYPFGIAPSWARRAAREAGYTYACGNVPGENRAATDMFALRRNEIVAADGSAGGFIRKLSGADDWFARIRELENAMRSRG